jgi:tetratricopeptide (TPR) repeat protein
MTPVRYILLVVLFASVNMQLSAESVADIDVRAQRFYSEKKFAEAIREWLSALDIDPLNEKIQQKIEMVYEEKHRKNLALQRSKMMMRETSAKAETAPITEVERGTKDAVDNFVIAYRIDPNDPELKTLRPKMEKFQQEMLVELEKKRRSEEDKRKYALAIAAAKTFMDQEKYAEALVQWKAALEVFEDDPTAKEGQRKAELAISNRLKFEQIKSYLVKGADLFKLKKYNEAIIEYKQVLVLDPKNDEAETGISRIEDILDGQRTAERKRQQAEKFYQDALDDIANNRFNEARDNFENALSLVPKYKDAEARIQSLKKLRDDYAERLRRNKLAEMNREFENGLIYFGDGRYREALSSFERAVVLDPQNTRAASYLEKTKEALREKQEEEIDQSSPYYDLVSSLIVSGKDLFDKGRFVESRERWDQIRSLFPNNRIALEYILKCDLKLDRDRFTDIAARLIEDGKASLEKRDFKKALSRFQLIKSIDAQYPGIDPLLASASARVKQPGRPAGANIQQLSPEEVERRYQQALNIYKQGGEANSKNALDRLRFLSQADPENTKVIIATNKIENEIRNSKPADDIQTGPKLTDNQKRLVTEYYVKGLNFYSSNSFDKAIEEWRKVLAIDPTHVKAKSNIRKTLEILKR